MKFFKNTKPNNFYNIDFLTEDLYKFFYYNKINKKNRKDLYFTRPGVIKSIKKISIFRDKNNTLIQQFINLNCKKGKKILVYKNVNNLIENLFFSLTHYSKEFEFYKSYSNFFYLYNSNINITSFYDIFENLIFGLESIFEIKTKKNNKKLKLKEKYSHEISYIPKERRKKYILRALSFYKESFKNYSLWERLFWSFFSVLINKEKSFLKKRREYIYVKSTKFFKKKNNPLK